MIILLVFAMFFFIYLTLEVTAVTQKTGIHRNVLTYLPIMFFTTALTLSSLWPDSRLGARPGKPGASASPSLTGKSPDDTL